MVIVLPDGEKVLGATPQDVVVTLDTFTAKLIEDFAIIVRLDVVGERAENHFVKIFAVHLLRDSRTNVVLWLKPFCNIIVVVVNNETKLSVTCSCIVDDLTANFPIPVAAHVV